MSVTNISQPDKTRPSVVSMLTSIGG
jgi:hypothetical protein